MDGTESDVTEVETPYVLETLLPITTFNDDDHVLHKISSMIAVVIDLTNEDSSSDDEEH